MQKKYFLPTQTLQINHKYEGKAKIVEKINENLVKITYKDDLTAFDGIKKATKTGKGKINLQISNLIFNFLESKGIHTHFVKQESENVIIAKYLEIVPLEFVVRNIAAGSFVRRYGLEKGVKFDRPIFELFLKSDELHDPLITPEVALKMGLISKPVLEKAKFLSLIINHYLSELFSQIGFDLVDFKLEFGLDEKGNLILADEITPDSIRLWLRGTQESFDKDVFREDKGDVLEVYEEVLSKLKNVDFEKIRDPNFNVTLLVRLKKSIIDAQGEVVKRSLKRLGMDTIERARIGKIIDLEFKGGKIDEVFSKLDKAIAEFLINPLIENFEVVL